MSLMNTFAPHPDEAALGYYRRLSAANSLWNWKELARMAGVSEYRTGLLNRPEFVASALDLEPDWANFAAKQEDKARSLRGLHRSRHDAICAECLTEEPYLRAVWEHGYVTACPVHKTALTERCPSCGEYLSGTRERIEHCVCGHDLRECESVPATQSQLWLSGLLCGYPKVDEKSGPDFRGVGQSDLSELVRVLCLYFDPRAPVPRRNAANPASALEAIEFLKPLESLIANWPTNFEAHVRERVQAGDKDARTLNKLLGRWYLSLKKTCRPKELAPLLETVLRVSQEDFDGVIGLDAAADVIEEQYDHVRLSQAAKSLGVGKDYFLETVKSGACEYRTKRFGTRGVTYEIPKDEVSRLKSLRARWVSEKVATDLLGLPESVLNNLAAANVLVSDVRWREDIEKGGPIELRSVHEFVQAVHRHAKLARVDDEVIQLANFTSRRLGDKGAIQAALKAVASGAIKAVTSGSKVGMVGFRRADVMAYFGTPLLESGMSIQKLAQTTGWKWESIAHWIDLGLLEAQSIELRGQPCRVVLPEHLLAFRQRFLPLADLAKAMGTRSSSLLDRLNGVQVIGAKPLPSGVKRGGLIALSDLGRLAVLGCASNPSQLALPLDELEQEHALEAES
jgi:hypothetical protein